MRLRGSANVLEDRRRRALAAGYANRLWTTARVAEVISKKFRVRYHRDHVGRLSVISEISVSPRRQRLNLHSSSTRRTSDNSRPANS
jgi:transposase